MRPLLTCLNGSKTFSHFTMSMMKRKETFFRAYSEKLALAYAILTTPPGAPISGSPTTYVSLEIATVRLPTYIQDC
ncbi:hypothetical protein GBA52_017990 [Prunus armeniaca]|nr:hypothetical protein GBA52_017990 [Prunus armeniaca]